MNKTYKVIYNRTRCMYQVVSELAKGRTKSETPEMLKNVFSKHGSLARGIVMAVLSMSLAMPVGVAVQAAVQAVDTSGSSASETTTNTSSTTATDTAANVDLSNLTDAGKKVITDNASATVTSSIGTLSTDGKYIKATASVSVHLSALDTQVKSNADAISAETTARTNADTSLTNAIGTLSADGNYIKTTNSVTGNLSALDTQAKANADAIAKETENRTNAVSAEAKAREDADTALSNKIGTTADGNYVKASDSVATNLGTGYPCEKERRCYWNKYKQYFNKYYRHHQPEKLVQYHGCRQYGHQETGQTGRESGCFGQCHGHHFRIGRGWQHPDLYHQCGP